MPPNQKKILPHGVKTIFGEKSPTHNIVAPKLNADRIGLGEFNSRFSIFFNIEKIICFCFIKLCKCVQKYNFLLKNVRGGGDAHPHGTSKNMAFAT